MSKEIKKDAIAVKDENLPDFIRNDKTEGGLRNIKSTDLPPAFVKLMQSKSKEVEADGSTIKRGEMINSDTMENYHKELTFIPLIDLKQAIKWIPRDSGGGMDCTSPDAISGSKYGICAKCDFFYEKWKELLGKSKEEKDKAGICTGYLNFPSIVNNSEMPIIVSFGRTSFSAGVELAKKYRAICVDQKKNITLYSLKFKLITKSVTKNNNTYEVLEVVPDGFTNQVEYEKCKSIVGTLNLDVVVGDTSEKIF